MWACSSSDAPETVSAARFTTNARVGAPIVVSRQARTDGLRAVVANAAHSNVGDGRRGLETAVAMQAVAAEALGVEPDRVAVASTGVIGTELPREPVLAGVRAAAARLGEDAATFSEAIMTSDRAPKRACLEVALPAGTVRLSAQAKGAGMISPRHATMFCFVQTDARLMPETVDLLTGVCVKRSFDRITVDGQLSTSDTVVVQAGGASGVAVEPETADEIALGEALDALMRQLALEIVADGEGTERIARVIVRGRAEAVEAVARSVANSPLVKTALNGADPNFGRVLQAAGQAWPPARAFRWTSRSRAGSWCPRATPCSSRRGSGAPWRPSPRAEVEFELTVPGEGGETEVFFSDLSEGYVRFNSSYTS